MPADANKERGKTAKAKAADQSGTIRIRLVRSVIGSSPHQRAVVAGLGLRRINQVVERENTREIRGMVDKVCHLVQIIS
jgi:large subunit ribosomal protein L30